MGRETSTFGRLRQRLDRGRLRIEVHDGLRGIEHRLWAGNVLNVFERLSHGNGTGIAGHALNLHNDLPKRSRCDRLVLCYTQGCRRMGPDRAGLMRGKHRCPLEQRGTYDENDHRQGARSKQCSAGR